MHPLLYITVVSIKEMHGKFAELTKNHFQNPAKIPTAPNNLGWRGDELLLQGKVETGEISLWFGLTLHKMGFWWFGAIRRLLKTVIIGELCEGFLVNMGQGFGEGNCQTGAQSNNWPPHPTSSSVLLCLNTLAMGNNTKQLEHYKVLGYLDSGRWLVIKRVPGRLGSKSWRHRLAPPLYNNNALVTVVHTHYNIRCTHSATLGAHTLHQLHQGLQHKVHQRGVS